MKKYLLLLTLFPYLISAQEASINIKVDNATGEELYFYRDVFVEAELLTISEMMNYCFQPFTNDLKRNIPIALIYLKSNLQLPK